MPGTDATANDDDPFLWLEDVLGERALAWVRAENAITMAALGARPDFAPLRSRLLAILESEERIPDRAGDWAYIRRYSPYHNLAAGRAYPRVLFKTSTRDDRVHPGHARKMAARMKTLGAEVLYYENIEGGHAGAADNPQRAHMEALAFTFLWKELANAR